MTQHMARSWSSVALESVCLDEMHVGCACGRSAGITMLVALTGRGALGLLNACDDALEEPDTAEGIAAADAGWSAAQARS